MSNLQLIENNQNDNILYEILLLVSDHNKRCADAINFDQKTKMKMLKKDYFEAVKSLSETDAELKMLLQKLQFVGNPRIYTENIIEFFEKE